MQAGSARAYRAGLRDADAGGRAAHRQTNAIFAQFIADAGGNIHQAAAALVKAHPKDAMGKKTRVAVIESMMALNI